MAAPSLTAIVQPCLCRSVARRGIQGNTVHAARSIPPRSRSATAARRPTRAGPTMHASPCSSSINYEEGGENCILHGDAASEAFLSEIVGAQAWPGQRHMNMEFDLRVRLARRLLAPVAPVHRTRHARDRVRRRHRDGAQPRSCRRDEGGRLGDRHARPQVDRLPGFRRGGRARPCRSRRSASTPRSTGERPLGIYQGRTSVHSLDIVMEEGGFLYSADTYADELPYWVRGPRGPHLIVPYTLDANDMRFATPQGFNAGDQFYRLSQGLLRRALCRRRCRRAQDAVRRPALPARRPAGPRRRARALPRLRAAARQRLGRDARSTSPATGSIGTRRACD